MNEPHWTKTATGYESEALGAKLDRRGKSWDLTMASGQTMDLGRKATFDAAERTIAEMDR